MNKLVSVEHHVPTVAVKFYGDDLLLVGHGSHVRVYNYKTSEVLASKLVFKKNKVHGIAFHRDTFILYGARSLNILSLKQILEEDHLENNEKMVNDWIISAEFCANGLEIFILTAHNIILSIDAYSQTLQWEKSVYGEKSILYSGSIKVISKYEVFINAGTVMGGVIIWDLYKEEIVHSLSGHEGSIFNVQSSSDNKYIISCSDDRSIKLWDSKTGELLSTAWGHTARIWNLKFYKNDEAAVSVSEDLSLRTWKIVDNQLIANQTYELHSGRHVWGLDVNTENTYAATSGNDGRIRLTDINPKKVEDESVHFSLSSIIDLSGNIYTASSKEIIKGLWKFKIGLVIITSEGGIFVYNNFEWKFLTKKPEFNNFILVNGYYEQSIISLTNNKGETLLIKFDEFGNILKEKTVITEVSKVINALSTIEKDYFHLMIESPNPNDKISVYKIDNELEILSTIHIVKKPTFVTTAFEVSNDIIFIGYRLSSLGIYKINGEEIKFIKKLSISDTITSINKVKKLGDELLLTITNRDGYYLFLKFNSQTFNFEFVHTNNTRKGFLEGSFNIDNELIVYGFKSSYFYIYNESKQFEIAYENCGGAHRLWKLFKNEDNSFEFYYIRDGILTIRLIPISVIPNMLNEGTHGREIRDISIRKDLNNYENVLYVTGAEDTTLKVSSINLLSGHVKNYWTIRKHTSGLQKVKFLNNNLIASSSAREEFFIWKIDEDFGYPLISLVGSLNPSSDEPDLRIMDFDHQFIYQQDETVGILLSLVYSDSSIKLFYYDLKTSEFENVISGFYKTCCLWDVRLFIEEDKLLLLTGSTDGYLTLWDITEECSLKLTNSKLQYNKIHPAKLPTPQSTISIHQNGIKSFEVISEDGKFLVATGSDDNGLAITEFKLSDGLYKPELMSLEPDAASSTITSLSYLNGYRLLVASVDQIVRLWDFKSGKLELVDSQYTTVADTGSSDTITKDDKDYGLVGGCGLSLWEIK